jgi:hypothetical protein
VGRRRVARKRRAPADLPAWPLDPTPPEPPTPAAQQRHVTSHPAPAPGVARPGLRRFFCRTCRGGEVATDPPQGWLRVQIRDEALARRNSQTYATTGLFCSVACLAAWATTASNGEATG